jgi:hypothetical protein
MGPIKPEPVWVDQVARMEDILRQRLDWRVGYDGQRDVFTASRYDGDGAEITRRELKDLLDELERQ